MARKSNDMPKDMKLKQSLDDLEKQFKETLAYGESKSEKDWVFTEMKSALSAAVKTVSSDFNEWFATTEFEHPKQLEIMKGDPNDPLDPYVLYERYFQLSYKSTILLTDGIRFLKQLRATHNELWGAPGEQGNNNDGPPTDDDFPPNEGPPGCKIM